MSSLTTFPSLLRLLADRTRLRVLFLLTQEELGVSELARILGLSPSRLGNHLRLLREAGLVADRKEGNWTFVRLAKDGALPADLWDAVRAQLERGEDFVADSARLREVLEARRAQSRSYFDRIAAEWDVIGSDFRTGIGRHRVAAALVPPELVIADVGCGTGYLSAALVPLARKLILVDHSPAMLEQARANLAGSEAELEFREGELDALPLEDGEVDGVVAGLVLHHAPDLSAFLREAHRVLREGGVLVVEDLLPHREAWLRESMADLRLGIPPEELASRLREVGFADVVIEVVEDSYRPARHDGTPADLPIFLVRCRKGPLRSSFTFRRPS